MIYQTLPQSFRFVEDLFQTNRMPKSYICLGQQKSKDGVRLGLQEQKATMNHHLYRDGGLRAFLVIESIIDPCLPYW